MSYAFPLHPPVVSWLMALTTRVVPAVLAVKSVHLAVNDAIAAADAAWYAKQAAAVVEILETRAMLNALEAPIGEQTNVALHFQPPKLDSNWHTDPAGATPSQFFAIVLPFIIIALVAVFLLVLGLSKPSSRAHTVVPAAHVGNVPAEPTVAPLDALVTEPVKLIDFPTDLPTLPTVSTAASPTQFVVALPTELAFTVTSPAAHLAEPTASHDLPTEPIAVVAQGHDAPSPAVIADSNLVQENLETPVTPPRVSSRVRAKTAEGRLVDVPTSPVPAGAAVRRLLPLSPSQVPNIARQPRPAAVGQRTPVLPTNRPSEAIHGSRTYQTTPTPRVYQVIRMTPGLPASTLSATKSSSHVRRHTSKVECPGGVDFPLLRAAERHHYYAAASTSLSVRDSHYAHSRRYLDLHAQQQAELAFGGIIRGHARRGVW
ncbi:hypothetical protein B0H16DRAFT_138702 [Mycena metata]|uniref:Transmembrane protein n=1 Tax=Mycena metata TaxID=1033252 RepID=A0AAD7NSH6_9AGAR|nr:hypothetical protein B0H16DRAFT_138702 [Mycena metata]